MTNSIEKTRHAMYYELNKFAGPRMYDAFQSALEAHLEELRQAMRTMALGSAESLKMIETLAAKGNSLIEERDTLRNKLQALQMASSTAAEVIRGLRSELEEAREGLSNPLSQDIYMMGFNGLGTPCPYPTNTIERLHWMDGARERMELLGQSCGVAK